MDNLYNTVDELKEMLFGTEYQDKQKMIEYEKEIWNAVNYGGEGPPPKYLMMKVTNRCNSNCCYCNHSADNRSLEEKSEIPIDVLKKAIKKAGEVGVLAATMSGGEPLLRDDIPALTSYIRENNMVPVLLTNGILLPKYWDELGAAGLRYIIISIDSFKPEVFKLQRGIELEKVLPGLDAAVRMREKYSELKIHVTPVVTKYNILELPDMIKRFSNIDVSVQLSPYHHFNSMQPDYLTIKDKLIVDNVINKIINMKSEGYKVANTKAFLEHFSSFFIQGKKVPDNYKCLAGYVSLYVDAYMNVHPCWSSSMPIVGNISVDNIDEIWRGQKYKEVRRNMKDCKCDGCWFLCTGEVTMNFMREDA